MFWNFIVTRPESKDVSPGEMGHGRKVRFETQPELKVLYVSSKFHGDILNISRDKELLSANLLGLLGLPMCIGRNRNYNWLSLSFLLTPFPCIAHAWSQYLVEGKQITKASKCTIHSFALCPQLLLSKYVELYPLCSYRAAFVGQHILMVVQVSPFIGRCTILLNQSPVGLLSLLEAD